MTTKLFVTDLSAVGLSTDYLYAEDSNIKTTVKIDPVDNGGEKIATITVNGVATEISANSSNLTYIKTINPKLCCDSASSYAILGNSNTIFAYNSFVVGKNNVVGSNGFAVVNAVVTTYDSKSCFELTLDGKLTEADINKIEETKPFFSLDSSNATHNVGKVLHVKSPSSLIVDNWRPDSSNCALYFPSFPHIGNVQIGNYSSAEGLSNFTNSDCAHAEGAYTEACGNYAHTEGKYTKAAWGAHAEGCDNRAMSEASHVEGRLNKTECIFTDTIIPSTFAPYSHVDGTANIASAPVNHVIGYMAHGKHDCSFVWNGEKKYGYQGDNSVAYEYTGAGLWELPDTELPKNIDLRAMEYLDSETILSSMYESNAVGSFNINPENGISGFYIGKKNLHDILMSYANEKPLSAKTYDFHTMELIDILADCLSTLGATVNK